MDYQEYNYSCAHHTPETLLYTMNHKQRYIPALSCWSYEEEDKKTIREAFSRLHLVGCGRVNKLRQKREGGLKNISHLVNESLSSDQGYQTVHSEIKSALLKSRYRK